MVLYLLHFQLLPEQRLAEAMADLFGVHLATATIASMSRACAARFSGVIVAPRPVGHNLLLRLRDRKEDVLRFLSNPAAPFTNTLAERDARMVKLRQKISGGIRSSEGARDFSVVRSLISTAKKHGWNVIRTLNQAPDTLLALIQVA